MRAKLAVAALVLLAGCARPVDDPAAFENALREANAAYDKALVEGDAAALDRIYTDDFQIIDDDANVSGKQEQIRFITQEVDLLDARSDDVRISRLGQGSALVTGRFSGRYRYQGEEQDFTERYTSVWVRQDGNWRMKHEHSSIVPSAGEQPET